MAEISNAVVSIKAASGMLRRAASFLDSGGRPLLAGEIRGAEERLDAVLEVLEEDRPTRRIRTIDVEGDFL